MVRCGLALVVAWIAQWWGWMEAARTTLCPGVEAWRLVVCGRLVVLPVVHCFLRSGSLADSGLHLIDGAALFVCSTVIIIGYTPA